MKEYILFLLCHGILCTSQEIVTRNLTDGELLLPADFEKTIEDLSKEMEDIVTNAAGVGLFFESLQKAIANEETSMTIPKEIDPDERSIDFQAAADTIQDFAKTEQYTAKRFLEKVEDAMALSMDNMTKQLDELQLMIDTAAAIIEGYDDVLEEISETKQSLSVNQLYEYLYEDEMWTPSDEFDSKSNVTKKESFEYPHPQNGVIPYGNDAHFAPDEDNSQQELLEREKLVQQNEKFMGIVVKKAKGLPCLPVYSYVLIALGCVVFLTIIVMICICLGKSRNSEKPPASLAEETKKGPISIVTIPVGGRESTPDSGWSEATLPSYLEVISK